jgi:hypothetical protein
MTEVGAAANPLRHPRRQPNLNALTHDRMHGPNGNACAELRSCVRRNHKGASGDKEELPHVANYTAEPEAVPQASGDIPATLAHVRKAVLSLSKQRGGYPRTPETYDA